MGFWVGICPAAATGERVLTMGVSEGKEREGGKTNHHVFVQLSLLRERVPEVAFEFLVVGDSARCFGVWGGWGRCVLGHVEEGAVVGEWCCVVLSVSEWL